MTLTPTALDELEKLHRTKASDDRALNIAVFCALPSLLQSARENAELRFCLGALLGEDHKMDVAIGGNPTYVDEFLARATAALKRGEP